VASPYELPVTRHAPYADLALPGHTLYARARRALRVRALRARCPREAPLSHICYSPAFSQLLFACYLEYPLSRTAGSPLWAIAHTPHIALC
jgi:hypothetical protein